MIKKKYKALILDLDGTTIPNSRDGMPSQRVIDAIMKAHEKVFVIIATGRRLQMTVPIIDILKITNPVILLGGSQIMDGASREYIYEKHMQSEDVPITLNILKPYHNLTRIDEKDKAFEYFPSYKPNLVYNIYIVNLSEVIADDIIKQISHLSTVAAHKIVDWEKGKIVVNISHAEATKQHAMYKVAKLLKIDTHETIGVGDGYNDFPLLMACGLKVAMGNAVSELKAIADYIAPSVDDDGVADVIEKFIL
jgi:HAD superfamily hydrolase (TIGR01484 family)